MTHDPLMLSVSGLRGIIGTSLTPTVAARYAAAVGHWFITQHQGGGAPHVVLGRDSRPSGQELQSAVARGLASAGCRVTTVGIVSTPGVAVMVQHLRAAGGVVITASHNPIQWNGIKTLRHDGVAPSAEQAHWIIERFGRDVTDIAPRPAEVAPAHDPTAAEVHVNRVVEHLDAARIGARKLKAVVDSVHGGGGVEAALLLRRLGVELVHLYAQPTGRFPHEPEPTRQNLTELCDVVRRHGADVGFAQDPDADRLAIVDERGRYIGEEYTLVLSALAALSRKPGPMAANLSTSRMIDDVAARFGVAVHRTPVGEAHVAEAMRRAGAVLGGEGNGGVIWPVISNVRDSVVGMGLVLELLAGADKPLSGLVAGLPAYAIVKDKLPIRPGQAQPLLEALPALYPGVKIDRQDGVRLDWSDRWVHVRPSNTEPILRLIAEAADESAARRTIDDIRQRLGLNR